MQDKNQGFKKTSTGEVLGVVYNLGYDSDGSLPGERCKKNVGCGRITLQFWIRSTTQGVYGMDLPLSDVPCLFLSCPDVLCPDMECA